MSLRDDYQRLSCLPLLALSDLDTILFGLQERPQRPLLTQFLDNGQWTYNLATLRPRESPNSGGTSAELDPSRSDREGCRNCRNAAGQTVRDHGTARFRPSLGGAM